MSVCLLSAVRTIFLPPNNWLPPVLSEALLAGATCSLPSLSLASAISPSIRPHGPAPPAPTQTQEMTIPNDLVGCIIGRGGNKINEIRQASGAQIKISNCEEGARERKITITGTPDTISAAQFLINNR